MKILLKNKYQILFFFFLFIPNSHAQGKIQILDPSLSSVRFHSNSILKASGKFTSYSGQLLMNRISKKIEEVRLTLNASKIELDPSDNPMQILTVTELMRSLPNATLNFVSKEVIAIEKNTYRILGSISRGTQKWNVNFQVKLNHSKNYKQTECVFKNEAKIPQDAQNKNKNQIPTGLNAIGGNLEFEGKLVFKEKG